jgi:hypothetical protein
MVKIAKKAKKGRKKPKCVSCEKSPRTKKEFGNWRIQASETEISVMCLPCYAEFTERMEDEQNNDKGEGDGTELETDESKSTIPQSEEP